MQFNNRFRKFVRESGFKVLSMAHLSQCEYSLMFYLINCTVSGLDEFITTEGELASLIGYDDVIMTQTIRSLVAKNMIRVHYGDNNHNNENPSLLIGMQYDMSKWVLAYDIRATSQDAIVFPFRRAGTTNLQVLEGQKKDRRRTEEDSTWKRVLDSFLAHRSVDDEEMPLFEEAAQILVETHPVDQVLLMIRHFGHRIPTLSLLASSWQHYQELFESETQKVDLLGARQKHIELDNKIKTQVMTLLENTELELTEEERTVLQILAKHRHPRRQLFWAYQLRSRYPNLTAFFADNVSLMLSVTTGGTVVKKHD